MLGKFLAPCDQIGLLQYKVMNRGLRITRMRSLEAQASISA
jgi:hypothetical protein